MMYECYYRNMAKATLTVIDNQQLRGVIAPAAVLTRKLLEDIVDFIEWSTPRAVKETEQRVREADRKKSWLSAHAVERRLKVRARIAR